mmetsp:Transcript_20405/g.62867  ORF Transcript_20405/g.62867 Transcript_20405/m.62867 type:complete len:90 (+) Transcript_20405:266-535(+)
MPSEDIEDAETPLLRQGAPKAGAAGRISIVILAIAMFCAGVALGSASTAAKDESQLDSCNTEWWKKELVSCQGMREEYEEKLRRCSNEW